MASALALGACAHTEDRRWQSAAFDQQAAPREAPTATVYAFSPPDAGDAKLRVKDLAGEGQAAFVAAMADPSVDKSALLKQLASPFGGDATARSIDRSRLERTVVITVAKGEASQPGDRLMRTVVTITPHRRAGDTTPPFEFAGYRIAATDTKVQNIAHLEDETDASLTATLAPKIGGFGDNSVEGKLARTSKTSADIAQQYENLSVDITPDQMIVTRESERGLDVVGNTLVALTLGTPADAELAHSAYLGMGLNVYDKGKALAETDAALDATPLRYIARCPLEVDVTLHYQLRRITRGREHYTEGKQDVAIVTGTTPAHTATLVRASEAEAELYQLLDGSGSAVLVQRPGVEARRLVFDSFEDAKAMASWLSLAQRAGIGKAGLTFNVNGAGLPVHGAYHAMSYSVGCPAT